MKEGEVYGTCKVRNSYKIFVRKIEKKRLAHRWEDNIKVDVK
jgi:hypothetical protein